MTRDQIISLMAVKPAYTIFYTMQLGGNGRQLAKMEEDGLITSASRYGGRHRQRNWYLTEEQLLARPDPAAGAKGGV